MTAPDVSFDRMKALQKSVEDVIRKDPDVLGAVSVVGVGTIKRNAERRAFRPHLEAQERAGDAAQRKSCNG